MSLRLILIFYLIFVTAITCETVSKGKNITGKGVAKSGGYYESCYSDLSCDGRMLCVDGYCRCPPNYSYSYSSGTCNSFTCYLDSKCQDYDYNRRCNSYGSCDCKVGFTEDPSNGKKCKIVNDEDGKFCTSDSSCPHTNQLCVDNRCRCAPNYKWNSASQLCSYFSCDSLMDCDNRWDTMRRCDGFGRCVCYSDNWKENSGNGRKCEADYGVPLGTWLWAVIVIPIVAIATTVALVVYYRRRQLATRQTNVVVYRY